jgi:hemerythrin-like domain-containing protein
VIDGSVLSRADVEAAAAIYLTYYRHHLATEDREILPRAARLLTAQEWRRVGEAAPAAADPLFGDVPQSDDRHSRLRARLHRAST